jgi:hypothetical protein
MSSAHSLLAVLSELVLFIRSHLPRQTSVPLLLLQNAFLLSYPGCIIRGSGRRRRHRQFQLECRRLEWRLRSYHPRALPGHAQVVRGQLLPLRNDRPLPCVSPSPNHLLNTEVPFNTQMAICGNALAGTEAYVLVSASSLLLYEQLTRFTTGGPRDLGRMARPRCMRPGCAAVPVGLRQALDIEYPGF